MRWPPFQVAVQASHARLMKPFGSLAVTLAFFSCPTEARAEARTRAIAENSDANLRLAWVRGVGAEGCPSERALADQVAQRLSRQVFFEGASRALEGVVFRNGSYWSASIQIRDEAGALLGERSLWAESRDCQSIADAVTLAIALAIDPEAAMRPPAPSVDADAPPPAATSIQALPPQMAPSSQESSRKHRALAAGLFGVGLLPEAAPGVAIGMDIELSNEAHALARAMYFPERDASGETVAFGLTAVSAGPCFVSPIGRNLSAGACVSALLGAMNVVVLELQPLRPGQRLWAGASVGGTTRFAVTNVLSVELAADAIVPFVREEFIVTDRNSSVFQQSPLAFLGAVNLGVSIP